MTVKTSTEKIMRELKNNVQFLEAQQQLGDLTDAIVAARYIFLAGKGRFAGAMQGFAKRLIDLGCAVRLLGDITAQQSGEDDLLIVSSASGETESLIFAVQKARQNGLKVALLTMASESTIAKASDICAVLPEVSLELVNQSLESESIQPLVSIFEQICFLVYDGIILELMDRMSQTSHLMVRKQTNKNSLAYRHS